MHGRRTGNKPQTLNPDRPMVTQQMSCGSGYRHASCWALTVPLKFAVSGSRLDVEPAKPLVILLVVIVVFATITAIKSIVKIIGISAP